LDFSGLTAIQNIAKSTAAIRKYEKEVEKREKLSAEKRMLAQKLGLDKTAENRALLASEDAIINSMRTTLAEMKVAHNKFVKEHGYPSELFPE
jgi:hypothetical protein